MTEMARRGHNIMVWRRQCNLSVFVVFWKLFFTVGC
uniref:Uncharacterized protein n=1 Tax=Arundo donax TaxID=35708 RepID=A0A0A8XTS2_ARUDO